MDIKASNLPAAGWALSKSLNDDGQVPCVSVDRARPADLLLQTIVPIGHGSLHSLDSPSLRTAGPSTDMGEDLLAGWGNLEDEEPLDLFQDIQSRPPTQFDDFDGGDFGMDFQEHDQEQLVENVPTLTLQTVAPKKHGQRAKKVISQDSIVVQLTDSEMIAMKQDSTQTWDVVYETVYMANRNQRDKLTIQGIKRGYPDTIPTYLESYWDQTNALLDSRKKIRVRSVETSPNVDMGMEMDPYAQDQDFQGLDFGEFQQDIELGRDHEGSIEQNRSVKSERNLPWHVGSVASSGSRKTRDPVRFTPLSRHSRGGTSVLSSDLGGSNMFEHDSPAKEINLTMDPDQEAFLSYVNSVMVNAGTDFVFLSDILQHVDSPSAAAEAFFNVLMLASKQAIRVEQREAFGDIKITC